MTATRPTFRHVALLATSFALPIVLLACGPRLLGPTAVRVGCYESEVQISNEAGTWDKRTWTAVCRGKTWSCSGTEPPGGGQLTEVSCKMQGDAATAASGTGATPAAGPAAPPGGGCLYDNQCKGDRVCTKGVCVEPPAKPQPAAPPPPPPPKAAPTTAPAPATTTAPAASGGFFQ